MKEREEESVAVSRRSILKSSAILLMGGVAGRVSSAYSATEPAVQAAPPLPWKWVQLDPLEAGKRAYRAYLEKKG